jgi:hypothetical protein
LPEASVQVLVESTVELEQPAVKIDEIRAMVRDLTCTVIADKVIFQGVLHKQIFFVREDGLVAHQAEDVRFAGFVDVPGAVAGSACRIDAVIEFVDFDLIDPITLIQRVVVRIFVETLNGQSGIIVPVQPQSVTFFGNGNNGGNVQTSMTPSGVFTTMSSNTFHVRSGPKEMGFFSTAVHR